MNEENRVLPFPPKSPTQGGVVLPTLTVDKQFQPGDCMTLRGIRFTVQSRASAVLTLRKLPATGKPQDDTALMVQAWEDHRASRLAQLEKMAGRLLSMEELANFQDAYFHGWRAFKNAFTKENPPPKIEPEKS